ncbi:MAG: zinc ribbon domain-containing protein [Peptostreptococcaceae bacterium]
MKKGYICPKCDNNEYETDEICATGSGLSKIFDVQNRKFTALTCKKYKYTEFYKVPTSQIDDIFDFIIS